MWMRKLSTDVKFTEFFFQLRYYAADRMNAGAVLRVLIWSVVPQYCITTKIEREFCAVLSLSLFLSIFVVVVAQ